MTKWDCEQLFAIYDVLLEIYEIPAAREWLISPQQRLNDRRPCELIESPMWNQRVWALVRKLPEELDCE